MSARVYVVEDADAGLRTEGEFGPSSGGDWSVRVGTLRGGASEGVRVVEVDNGAFRVELLPTRGMGLWRGTFRGHRLGWDSPVRRPVHPAFVDQSARGGLGWLGGFNEWLCRCGLGWFGPPCDDDGWPLTLHGRIANTPAHFVSVTVDEEAGILAVRGVVDETELFGPALRLESTLTTELGSNRIEIHDRVTNLADQPAEMQLLYHVNVGGPFLEAGSTFHMAAEQVVPRDERAAEGVDDWTTYGGPEPGFAEQVYLAVPRGDAESRAAALLSNAAGSLGFEVGFDIRTLPHLSLWKNTGGTADGFVTGLEPGTGYPNPRPYEWTHGRVPQLAAGESRDFHLSLTAFDDPADVAARVAAAAAGDPPTLHRTPMPGVSAD